ncbi:hypothetical protein D9M70_59940 [compost metagenome]
MGNWSSRPIKEAAQPWRSPMARSVEKCTLTLTIKRRKNYFASICSFVTDIPWHGYMRLQKEGEGM